MLADGPRQIVGLYLPGDVIPAPSATEADILVWSLTPTATLCADRFWREAQHTAPTVASAWAAARDGARMQLVSQIVASANELDLPVTQDELADLLGLSSVHKNRTLQHLRRDRLVDYGAGRVVILDMKALIRVAGVASSRRSD